MRDTEANKQARPQRTEIKRRATCQIRSCYVAMELPPNLVVSRARE